MTHRGPRGNTNPLQHDMYAVCKLKNYDEARKWLARAQQKGQGRKYSSWAHITERFTPGMPLPDIYIHVRQTPVCRITPDNKLTMLLDGTMGKAVSNTLSMSLSRLVPVSWARVGMRRYRILSTGALKPDDSWWTENQTAPELFKGLQVDLSTHRFVNAKADMVQRVDGEARKVWLRAVKAFRRALVTRAKLGVFDAVAKKMENDPKKRFSNSTVDWTDEQWMNALYRCMRDQRYPMALLGAISLTIPKACWGSEYRHQTMAQKVERTVNYLVTGHSVELRTRFGVFSDEVSDEKAK